MRCEVTKRFKMSIALAVVAATLLSATPVTAGSNPTSLCGKIWKPRC
jgi:hypothetical protein